MISDLLHRYWRMTASISPATAIIMMVPPLTWAGNAIVGRLMHDSVPPLTLNFMRWLIAGLLLLPFAWPTLSRYKTLIRDDYIRLALLGLLGIFGYNSFQYLALNTSSPINVTLIASISPVWMVLIGRLFFKVPITVPTLTATFCTLCGVLFVLSRGDWTNILRIDLVPGDAWMLLATLGWTWYSWLLARPSKHQQTLSADWKAFLLIQIAFGLLWSVIFMTLEWGWLRYSGTESSIVWLGWRYDIILALLYIGVVPSLLAFRCWGIGVRRTNPQIAIFFATLTPIFASIFSNLFLGETPQWFHYVAISFIFLGIIVGARGRAQ